MILPIVAFGDPVLRKVGKEVDANYPELEKFEQAFNKALGHCEGK